MTVMRTEYWNLVTGTVRNGATGHGESLTDVDRYLLPMARARTSSVHSWGVATGLRVTATAGQQDVTVSPGTAVDAGGHLLMLAEDGVAIVDPNADPTDIQNVETVVVPAGGPVLATAGVTGDCLLTLTWREVLGSGLVANAPVLLHAPWLRLVPAAGFTDTGAQVVLAAVSLDAASAVTALSAAPRRVVDTSVGRVVLRKPREQTGAGLAVDHDTAAELRARPDGGVALNLLSGSAVLPALAVDPSGKLTLPSSDLVLTSGDVRVDAGDVVVASGDLVVATGSAKVTGDVAAAGAVFAAKGVVASGDVVAPGLRVSGPGGGRTYRVSSGPDSTWRVTDTTAGAERLLIDTGGNVGIGVAAGGIRRTLHVEPSEVHSGGQGAGYSFADRTVGSFVESPAAGERWVWYAHGGTARLWSGGDKLTVGQSGVGVMGALEVAGHATFAQGATAVGVVVGRDSPAVNYPFEYETVGVTSPAFNLRLQSPNQVIVHANGAPRLSVSQQGADVIGTYAIRGREALQGNDAWLRLNQARQFPNGVHTPGQLSASSLNVGGTGGIGWGDPGSGNVWVSGRLFVEGEVQLGAADQVVRIGGNQDGPFIQFHDDLWFSDPQTGMIEMRNADNSSWGQLRGLFFQPSSRTYKRDVALLASHELGELLSDALGTQVVRFRWSAESETARAHLGVIAEDAPPYILDDEGLSLSMPEYTAMLLGAVQVLAARVSALEEKTE